MNECDNQGEENSIDGDTSWRNRCTHLKESETDNKINSCLSCQRTIIIRSSLLGFNYKAAAGAYEGKECVTTMYTWVPSKYKFEPVQFP